MIFTIYELLKLFYRFSYFVHISYILLFVCFHLRSGLYAEGHKRLKLSSDRNLCDGMVLSASIDNETMQKKQSSSSAVVDYTDPLAIQNLLEEFDDCSKYGSVAKDMKSFTAQIHQVLNPLLARYPTLSKLYFKEGKRQSQPARQLAIQQAPSLAQNNIIDLEDDCVDSNAPAAPFPIVIIDSDEEQSEDQRPSYSFQEVFMKQPSYPFKDVILTQPSEQVSGKDFVVCLTYMSYEMMSSAILF